MARRALIARNRAEHGQAAFDTYTPLHFAFGLTAGLLGVSPVTAALVFTAAKVAVASAEKGMGHALFRKGPGESNLNELCDLLAELGGLDIGARLRKTPPSQITLAAPATAAPQTAAPTAGIFR